jgi:acyl-ACP thioesterase
MEPIFRKTFTLSSIHMDRFRRAKPSVLLYLAQEAACGHCDQLALDWDTLAQKDLFWAIIRHRVQITRLPTEGETITVETWPLPTTRSAFPRATVGYDEEGKELFRTMALWVLMNTKTRTMVLPGKSGIGLEGLLRGTELATPSSILPKNWENHFFRQVRYSELDRNGHMNNTRYLDWVADLLPSVFHKDHTPKELLICYASEALETQEIHLDWELNQEGILQIDAHRESTDVSDKKHRVFSAQVLY